jgi:putative phosphoesterase
MAKYGIISDTHIDPDSKVGNLLKELRDIFEDVKFIFHAGDINSQTFLDELNNIAPTYAVKGNTDSINNLKDFFKIEIEGYILGLIHKIPENKNQLEDFCMENDLIGGVLIYGHTHQPLIKGTSFNTLLLNPGSPTHPKAPDQIKGFTKPQARPSVIILTIDNEIITSIIVNLTKKEEL